MHSIPVYLPLGMQVYYGIGIIIIISLGCDSSTSVRLQKVEVDENFLQPSFWNFEDSSTPGPVVVAAAVPTPLTFKLSIETEPHLQQEDPAQTTNEVREEISTSSKSSTKRNINPFSKAVGASKVPGVAAWNSTTSSTQKNSWGERNSERREKSPGIKIRKMFYPDRDKRSLASSNVGDDIDDGSAVISVSSNCPSGYFECAVDSSLCVPQAAICNGKSECPDSSDEIECENLHDKKFWDTFFQKRPGADVGKNDSCKYTLTGKGGEDSGPNYETSSSTNSISGTTTFGTFGIGDVGGGGGHYSSDEETLLSSCHCSGEKLFCQNLHLPNLNIIPGDVVFLDLSGSRVDNLNFTADASQFQQLHTLILSSTTFTELKPELLSPLESLQDLHLTGNKLQSIPNNTFSKNINLKKLFLGYNQLSSLQSHSFKGLKLLEELDLRHNKLTGKEPRLFTDLQNLQTLHLSYNEMEFVGREFFSGLEKLGMLSLTKNRITYIEPGAFEGMTSLNHLYLSYNRLEVVEDRTFCNLRSLLNLNLNDNGISRIEPEAFECLDSLQSLVLERNKFGELDQPISIFSNLTELQYIYFDQFWACFWVPHVRNCEPKGDGISSIENLLDNVVLRTCVWIMGLVGVIGNAFVIVSRMVLREKNPVHSFYIKNLAVADLLMGIFLLSIAFADVTYRGEFLARQHSWRHSITCQYSGLLSTLSSESSVFILFLITLDRYLSIVWPFKERRNALLPAIFIIIILWTISFILSFLPLSGLFKGYFGENFYTSNGLCLPLHLHDPYNKGWQFSLFLFVILNSIAFSFITFAYIRMHQVIKTSTTSIRSTQKQDTVLAQRFALVVITDFLCWAPVIISKILAMSGVPIQSHFYAWLAVFVLPVNSALNPIIYTLTTKLFKQQVAHFTVGFRKRLGMATDESTTSSLFYRNRISRTLNTSLNSSLMLSTKVNNRGSRLDRVDRANPNQQIRNRYTVSSINSVVATSTGLNSIQVNGQVNPVDAITNEANDIKYDETET